MVLDIRHQEIDGKGPRGQISDLSELTIEVARVSERDLSVLKGADASQRTRVGYRGRKVGGCEGTHSRLDYRVVDAQKLAQRCPNQPLRFLLDEIPPSFIEMPEPTRSVA